MTVIFGLAGTFTALGRSRRRFCETCNATFSRVSWVDYCDVGRQIIFTPESLYIAEASYSKIERAGARIRVNEFRGKNAWATTPGDNLGDVLDIGL